MASRKNKSGGNGSSFASGSERVVDQAKSSAEDVVNKARDKASEVAGEAQSQARSQLSMGKDRVADSMDSVANALRSTTQQLQDQDAGIVDDYLSRAADKVSEVSRHLRESDVNELVHETEDFARREPAIFLAGAFALGLIAVRFLKSSGNSMEREEMSMGRMGYDDYAYGGYDRDASASYNESGATGAVGGVSRVDDQPFGGTAGMAGSGVMGDSPYTTGPTGLPSAPDDLK